MRHGIEFLESCQYHLDDYIKRSCKSCSDSPYLVDLLRIDQFVD